MLVWEEEFSVGDATIDDQHKMFIKKINDFETAAAAGTGKEVLHEMMEFLGDYARRHFFDEESYMERHGYPGLKKHAQIHQGFIQAYQGFMQRLQTEGETTALAQSITIFMSEWLVNHIIRVDKAFAEYIATGQRGEIG